MMDLDDRFKRTCAGPTFAEDGRLILDESFTSPNTVAAPVDDWLVEVWRIWDCEAADWTSYPLVLLRFESEDRVVRTFPDGRTCTWLGAVDTYARILSSRDSKVAEGECWQWLRDPSCKPSQWAGGTFSAHWGNDAKSSSENGVDSHATCRLMMPDAKEVQQ